jgi:hypothetical protein
MPAGSPLDRFRTRFAPAPTGYLHLGHVLNALEVWAFAMTSGARVILRVEDHDRQRSRLEFERAMRERRSRSPRRRLDTGRRPSGRASGAECLLKWSAWPGVTS